MKFMNCVILLVLSGFTLQSWDNLEDNWSSGSWNNSSNSDVSLDSILSSGNSSIISNNDSLNASNWSNNANLGASGSNWSTSLGMGATTTESAMTSEVLYSKPEITQTQEIYSKPVITKKIISQPVITRKIVQQPIIKQRVVQTPIIRKQVVSRPVYTETKNLDPIIDNQTSTRTVPINVPGKTTIREQYYQPTVLTKDVQLQINRGESRVNNLPVVTRPTQYSEQVVNRVFQAPAKEIYTQPIYQKTIVNNTERVNFQKSEPQYQTRQAIQREPIVQERTRYETVTRPGKEIYNNTYIQPIVQRENVNVQFNRMDDRTVQLDPIVEPTQYNTRTRTQTIQTPGHQIITQPIIQNYVEQRDIHHVQQPVVQRVPVHRPFPVPTPVIKKVPIVRRIPVPVVRKSSGGTKIYNLSKISLNGLGSYKGSDDSSEDADDKDYSYDKKYSYDNDQSSGYKGNYYQNYQAKDNAYKRARYQRNRSARRNDLRVSNQNNEYDLGQFYHNYMTPESLRPYYQNKNQNQQHGYKFGKNYDLNSILNSYNSYNRNNFYNYGNAENRFNGFNGFYNQGFNRSRRYNRFNNGEYNTYTGTYY